MGLLCLGPTPDQPRTNCHPGNIAFKTGEKILWDGEAEKINNSAAANSLLTRQYRAPWQLPGL